MQRKILLLLFSALLGCNKAPSPVVKDPPKLSLEERVKKLEQADDIRDLMDGADRVAYLTPADQGYSLARADFGNVAVVLEDVRDYASGVKANLRFGNITSASVAGLQAKIEWGSLNSDGAPVGEQHKSEAFSENLPAASWHSYEIILPNVPATKLGYVRVSEIKSASINLIRR